MFVARPDIYMSLADKCWMKQKSVNSDPHEIMIIYEHGLKNAFYFINKFHFNDVEKWFANGIKLNQIASKR